MASLALNCDLRTGSVRPWREALEIFRPEPDTVSCFVWDGRLVTWPLCVEATGYLTDYGRMFVTGRSVRPEAARRGPEPLEYEYLGVPAPEGTVEIAGTEEFGEDSDARSYVYTYLNRYAEESAPSLPGPQMTVKDGAAVTLSGFVPPPPGWGIVAMNLYRSVSGIRKTAEDMNSPASSWHLVETLPPDPGEVLDDLPMKDLGPALDTEDVRIPPAGLRQIAHVPATGILCGADGHRLHFSENFQPWNWPVENDMTFPHGIVNLGVSGPLRGAHSLASMDSLVFMTTSSRAYVVDGGVQCSQSLTSRRVYESREPMPDIGCGRRHSAVMTPYGMIYSTALGLTLLKADATFEVLTALWYTPAQWARLRPDTARLAFWQGMVFCVTDGVSLVLEVDPKPYADGETGILTTISDRPQDLWTSMNGELMMLEDGVLKQWGAGDSWREYEWRSSELRFPGRITPTWARLRTDGTLFTLTRAGDVKESWTGGRYVSGYRPVRIPRLGRHDVYRFGLKGTLPVESVWLDVALYMDGEGQPQR
jgi:hypothetical protein